MYVAMYILTALYIHVTSVQNNCNQLTLQEFQTLIYTNSFDIIAITKTWLSDHIYDMKWFLLIMFYFVKIDHHVVECCWSLRMIFLVNW